MYPPVDSKKGKKSAESVSRTEERAKREAQRKSLPRSKKRAQASEGNDIEQPAKQMVDLGDIKVEIPQKEEAKAEEQAPET